MCECCFFPPFLFLLNFFLLFSAFKIFLAYFYLNHLGIAIEIFGEKLICPENFYLFNESNRDSNWSVDCNDSSKSNDNKAASDRVYHKTKFLVLVGVALNTLIAFSTKEVIPLSKGVLWH